MDNKQGHANEKDNAKKDREKQDAQYIFTNVTENFRQT